VQTGYPGSRRWLLLLSYHAPGIGAAGKPTDAAEFQLAGATAVQVGTASYADPRATERRARGLESWCKSHDVAKAASLIEALEVPGLGNWGRLFDCGVTYIYTFFNILPR